MKLSENLQDHELEATAQLATNLLNIKPLGTPADSVALKPDELTVGKLELRNNLLIFLICPKTMADQVEITDRTSPWLIHWVIDHPGVEFQQTVIYTYKESDPREIKFVEYKGHKKPPDTNYSRVFHPFYTGIPVVSDKIIDPQQIEQFSPQAIVFVVGSEAFDKRFPNIQYPQQVHQDTIAIYTQAPANASF